MAFFVRLCPPWGISAPLNNESWSPGDMSSLLRGLWCDCGSVLKCPDQAVIWSLFCHKAIEKRTMLLGCIGVAGYHYVLYILSLRRIYPANY